MKKVQHRPSKRFLAAQTKIDGKKAYPIAEAVALAKATSTVKFDASVEIHIKLNINTKKSDQQIRNTVILPHGTGKNLKLAVISTSNDQIKAAKEAGAEIAGGEEIINDIKENKIKFDILIATPEAMKLLAPIAKILGPKGLMPNPKDGTVAANAAEAVANLKKGKVNFKNDDSGNLHLTIGKVSFDEVKLAENFQVLMDGVIRAKPAGVKGNFIANVYLTTSMGPSIKVAV